MSSSLLVFDLDERKRIAAGTLAPLARALRDELQPLLGAPLPIPERKARLTRIGGRCALDGTLLNFDPYSPHEHHCPQCQRVYVGETHDDWWAMGAQLWTAERAVQAATIHLLCDDEAAGTLAVRILTEFAVRYQSWPNRDNALGPTHPFFSTYLESIWLLNICHAIALLECGTLGERPRRMLGEIRNTLVLPSRNLIASFNEGRSNRQVWNEVAIRSASRILGEIGNRTAHDAVSKLIANGLLEDGSWYEGENYHLFAHRGLWYGVQLLRALDHSLSTELDTRYTKGFVAPFLGLLPDDTFPSRRDSQYKVSIRQWRFAEWCELGLAHAHPNQILAGILHRTYDKSAPAPTARHRFSTADSERNEAPSQLSRADLSWRALLIANEHQSGVGQWHPQSVCLPAQGLAVLRRDAGSTYIALEGGHTGGGHGHPDRLSLTLQFGATRCLEDPGTGSYVERKLHWYRSTLAHFAPLFDGASQQRVPAQLLAFEDRGGAGWISKRVENIAPGVNATRTIIAADGYFIDVLDWESEEIHQLDLPLARSAEVNIKFDCSPADPRGAHGLEDGFDFLSDVVCTTETHSGILLNLPCENQATAYYASNALATYWRAEAPGSPGHQSSPLHWLRTSGKGGRVIGLWSWNDAVSSFKVSATGDAPSVEVVTSDGTTAHHSATVEGWHIALTAGTATSSIDLVKAGDLPRVQDNDADEVISGAHAQSAGDATPKPTTVPRVSGDVTSLLKLAGQPIAGALRFQLGEPHYDRTEQSWSEAGRPVATVQLGYCAGTLIIDVLSRTGTIVVPDVHAENQLDNERRDVNSSGVQIHLGARNNTRAWADGWLAVPAPETSPAARVTELLGTSTLVPSQWVSTPDGWAMRLAIPAHFEIDDFFALEVIVNERPPVRQRRRGQLVLSGGGTFGYLRGDRTEPANALTFRLPTG